MKKLLLTGLALLLLSLSGCGYHLVGHGSGAGAIPADVKTVTIAVNGDSQKVLSLLRQRLTSEAYALTDAADAIDEGTHAILRVNIAPLMFVPSAYDISGMATQYRMTYSGSLSVQRSGQNIWQSGNISQQGDVYESGGPASTEASKERLLRDLRQQWVTDALGRLRSGF
ncbi:MAG: adenosylmethionine-8-amino-7-oxononanoate aminotransferase [Zetaproteobacteria bacterium CG_4_9_14_3_um_filter_53_7]|nr:MAG: adenosylmethionine-8-amino-7-oxononanoate aminotransferase [Zetaproteobacteria bacterium CG_4_9_14_3_um_filter_53_7]